MGCSSPQNPPQMQPVDTPVGILKITIIGLKLNDTKKRKQENVKIRVSNQHFTSENVPPIGAQNVMGDCFSYVINSFYKSQGRVIEVGYFSGDSLISFGAVDADPIIHGSHAQNFRVILNHDKLSMHGFLLLRASFEVLPVYDITFRFEEATIRRKTNVFGNQHVAVRMTIGEEVRQTEFQVDSSKGPPVWVDTKYNFKVPHGVHSGIIELINASEEIIGSQEINIDDITSVKEEDEQLVSDTLYYQEKEQSISAADLKFTYILGKQANFGPRSSKFTSTVRATRSRSKNNSKQISLLPEEQKGHEITFK